ncbi:hypothetical protein [Fodinibius sp.]|uniref:hypothetical protein n=1 Tax=Fodinibius sp. TaxID=1872440 RepID=UPI002ACE28D1|nr:hypothetical protein [Fodinibius sp.]MDZ7660503.1 hypothetical protein [Fodinibius sp.]
MPDKSAMTKYSSKRGKQVLILISLALVSFSMILYEIVLSRIFSVILSYHYVFAILSLAMLGLGMGGLLLQKVRRIWPSSDTYLMAIITALILGFTTALILYFTQVTSASWAAVVTWGLLFLPIVPFLFFGMTIASFFQQAPERSSLLYGFDILGGAMAALFAVPLLNIVPAPAVAFIVTGIALLAGLLLTVTVPARISTIILSMVAIFFVAGGIWLVPKEILPIKTDQHKDINRLLYEDSNDGRIVETRWSAFGQTTLVESNQQPHKKMIYIDGAAGTSMFSFQALLKDSTLRSDLTSNFGQFFPFYFLKDSEKDSALIIGPGGGRDVLVALFGGVKSITAVEVNPDLVQIVKDYEDFNGGLYTRLPNLKVIVEEGRNFIRNSVEQYDLIMLALPVTKSSRSISGYALTENYLFTVEAFGDYLDRLTPEGRIIFVTHGNAELYKLLSLALTAFEQQGISNQQAMNYLYVVSKHNMPALVVKKKPFEGKDMQTRHAALHELGYDQGEYFVPFQEQASYVLPVPDDSSSTITWSMFDETMYTVSEGTMTMEEVAKNFPLNISPVYDDSPFFYNFDKNLPAPFPQFYGLIVLGIVVLIFPLSVKKQPAKVRTSFIRPFARHSELKRFLLVFVLLGAGFMMLEVSLFQKLSLYLSNPVSATSMLLFSLLLGVGIGSLISARIIKNLSAALVISTLAVFIFSLAYTYLLDELMASTVAGPFRAGLLTGLFGIAMGFPFPLALRLMKQHGLEEFTAAMWGSNGLASVAGAVLAMIIGIEWGFTSALMLGGTLYFFTTLFSLIRKPHVI